MGWCLGGHFVLLFGLWVWLGWEVMGNRKCSNMVFGEYVEGGRISIGNK